MGDEYVKVPHRCLLGEEGRVRPYLIVGTPFHLLFDPLRDMIRLEEDWSKRTASGSTTS